MIAEGVLAIEMAAITLVDALQLATINPGRFVGGRGWLALGEPADLIRFRWSPGDTDLVIDESYRIKTVDALLSGFHDAKATHTSMLRAVMDAELLEAAYAEAGERGYVVGAASCAICATNWFGDAANSSGITRRASIS